MVWLLHHCNNTDIVQHEKSATSINKHLVNPVSVLIINIHYVNALA